MLLTKEVEMKWNSKNIKHYKEKGYVFTHVKDSFIVNPYDLSDYSVVKINVKCDYCGENYQTTWSAYIHSKKICKKDCCNNPQCTGEKSKESLTIKYGVDNARKIEGVNDKIKKTNIEKYGSENPFSSEIIKDKIKTICLTKYGVEHPTQSEAIKEKVKETCISKYGVPCYLNLDYAGEKNSKENNPRWKGGVAYHRVERSCWEYRQWRTAVFNRDKYTCQCCGAKSAKGKSVTLVGHHIRNWKDNLNIRYDVSNGITLCEECHIQFHIKYGKKNNTPEQLSEFIDNYIDKKIC